MRFALGTVIAGKVEIDGETPVDGTRVTVLIPERGEREDLTPAQKAELLAAMAEPESDLVELDEVLRELRAAR